MRELSVKEIEQVNGGMWPWFVSCLAGNALNSAISHWRGASRYREFNDYRLAP